VAEEVRPDLLAALSPVVAAFLWALLAAVWAQPVVMVACFALLVASLYLAEHRRRR
jgi:hypothetical protein